MISVFESIVLFALGWIAAATMAVGFLAGLHLLFLLFDRILFRLTHPGSTSVPVEPPEPETIESCETPAETVAPSPFELLPHDSAAVEAHRASKLLAVAKGDKSVMQVIAMKAHGETFILFYEPGNEAAAIKTLAAWRDDPELSFDDADYEKAVATFSQPKGI